MRASHSQEEKLFRGFIAPFYPLHQKEFIVEY